MTRIIESFSKEEHVHLLKIIMEKDSAAVSENSNGTFVQMDEVSQETIQQMNKYIDYVLLKECDIKAIEETKERLKNNINE
jgi:sugar/nucleoside kinase (ribokinase family)